MIIVRRWRKRLIPFEEKNEVVLPPHCSFRRGTWSILSFFWNQKFPRMMGKTLSKKGELLSIFFLSLSEALELMQNLHPCLQSFRRWSVMQVVGLKTFFLQAKSSSSNLTSLGFSGRKSQDTDHGYSEEQNWIFYFPRGRTSKKGGGGGHVSLFRHVGKMSVLSYQSRSENWGDFLSGRCCECWKVMS